MSSETDDSRHRAIRFKLAYLSEPIRMKGVSANTQLWIGRLVEAFKERGDLSPRQMEVMEEIWVKAK